MPPRSTSTQSGKTPLRRTAPSVLKPSIRSLAMIIGSCPVLMTTTLFLADGSSTALFEGSIVADFAYPSNHGPALWHLCDPPAATSSRDQPRVSSAGGGFLRAIHNGTSRDGLSPP